MGRIAIHLINNDATPMEDVVRLLIQVFGLKHTTAFELMLKVHRTGRAAVAQVPANDAAAVRERLDRFVAAMGEPVAYAVNEDAPDDAPLVEIADLLPMEEYAEKEKRRRARDSRTFVVMMASLVAAAAIAAAIIVT